LYRWSSHLKQERYIDTYSVHTGALPATSEHEHGLAAGLIPAACDALMNS